MGVAILGMITTVAKTFPLANEKAMTFRAVALLALWTLLIGPVVGGAKVPSNSTKASATFVRR